MLEAFEGKFPEIAADAFVHEAAVVIGEVQIGSQSSVWPNVTLRGDDGPIIIGAQTSIQDGTTIHCTEGWSKTIVGNRVTVGHNVILHGCTIEDDVLIGMGAIVMDNVRVESGAMVAAGAVVPPNKVIKSGTVVAGNPFKVLRELRVTDKQMIEMGWREYVTRTAQYLAARAEKG